MAVDCYFSQPHYGEHLASVLEAIPADRRGHLFAHPALRHDPMLTRYEIEWGAPRQRSTDPLIVAGYQDLTIASRPRALLSHGAGQTYIGVESGSYDGGPGRDDARLHLCPNERSAQKNRDRYPSSVAVAVGCPKLDGYARIPAPESNVIAVAFHWRCTVAPEAEWAWPTWRAAIEEIADDGPPMVGHCHPRARYDLRPWFADLDIEFIEHPADLLARARTLVVDNSSLAYEWAAVGRPVAFMDGEQYRPGVNHGLRFGELLPGPTAGKSGEAWALLAAIESAPEYDAWAFAVAGKVYGPLDGHASERAAAAIMEHL